MYRDKCNYTDALEESLELFNKRVLLMRDDNLFITDYSKKKSLELHTKALEDVKVLVNL